MKHNKEKEEREKVAQKFFSHERRSLYDIIPRGKAAEEVERDEVATKVPFHKGQKAYFREDEDDTVAAPFREHRKSHRRFKLSRVTVMIIAIVVIGIGAYAFFELPEASIAITLQQKPFEFNETVSASVTSANIPMQVFPETKNMQISFPATGNKNVSRPAYGTLSVCNAFNSDPQKLVATTRFLAKDNIIFRLDSGITIPGATITDGKIQPKCIEAQVTADKPGAEYNVAAIARWYIPGFKESPKYEAFYGVSSKPMTGGLIGASKVPTAADIASARGVAITGIKRVLDASFSVKAPPGIIYVEDSGSSTSFSIVKGTPIEEVDASGNASYFIEAKDERIAVKEEDIKKLIIQKAQETFGTDFQLVDEKGAYQLKLSVTGKMRDSRGVISSANILVSFTGGFIQPLTEAVVKTEAAGKTEPELSNFIPTHKNFKAHITLWPFWVKRVPTNLDKIKVTIMVDKLESASPITTPVEQ